MLCDIDSSRLAAHDWPGNVRELKHAAERFVLGLPVFPDEAEPGARPQALVSQLGQCERALITTALVRHGSQTRPAAAELGISEKTLQRRMSEYQIEAGRRRCGSLRAER
jgi:two-component system C4-dicarboxylate transport response regulator DctD